MSFSFFKKGSKRNTPELPTKTQQRNQEALKAKQQAAIGNLPINVRAEHQKINQVLEDMHQKKLADQAVQIQQSQTLQSQEKPLTDREIRHQFDILQPRNPGEQRIYDDIALGTAYEKAFGAKTGTVVDGMEEYTEKKEDDDDETKITAEAPKTVQRPKTTLTLTFDATKEGLEKARAFEATFDQYLFKQIIQEENGLSQKVEVEKLPVNDVGPKAGSSNFSYSEGQDGIKLSFALIHRDAKQFLMNIIDHIKAQVKPSQTVEQSQGKEAQGKEVVEQENRSSFHP